MQKIFFTFETIKEFWPLFMKSQLPGIKINFVDVDIFFIFYYSLKPRVY